MAGRVRLRMAAVGLAVLASTPGPSAAQPAQAPRTLFLDPPILSRAKEAVLAHDRRLAAPYASLIALAARALQDGPFSVMQKSAVPPSGDKHDYLTLARYYWPNPATPDGLPYVNRDGEVNPEIRTIPDEQNMMRMTNDVRVLSLAYYFTGTPAYAEHAARLLRTWFLDPATRMNPNLTYAQIVRGRTALNPYGIIESRDLALIPDAVGLLEGSEAWPASDRNRLRAWFRQYLDWLLTSDQGRREGQSPNNHGPWYDQQVIAIGLFLNRTDFAASLLRAAGRRWVAAQIEPDGRQPLELRRTRSFHYSVFNLEALFRLAALGRHAGVDLWQYETADGRGIRKALDYLIPYALREQSWPYPEMGPWESGLLVPLLLQAAAAYHAPAYRDLASRLDAGAVDAGWSNLLYFEGR